MVTSERGERRCDTEDLNSLGYIDKR